MKLKLAREIAARTKPHFIEIPRERGGAKVPFTEEQLADMRANRRGISVEADPRVGREVVTRKRSEKKSCVSRSR